MDKNTRLFFLTPDNKKATGGVKQLYRQVDLLNKNGFNAFILHKKKVAKINWFNNQTKVHYNSKVFNDIRFDQKNINLKKTKKIKLFFKKIYNDIKSKYFRLNDIKFNSTDILIFPEIYGISILKIEKELKKVIFNQNCYYTFENFDIFSNLDDLPYLNKNIIATIVASKDAENYLKFTFPNQNLFRMRLGIDGEIFSFPKNKKRQIAFMPRKLVEDVVQVINILTIRKKIKNWDFIAIENKTENEVATILKESTIFLSFNYTEGFGLPPAEAMACGCTVIGYMGNGAKEYFKNDFCYPVEDRNIIQFVEKIEHVVNQFEKNPETILSKGKVASDFILNEYSIENEEKDIINIWNSILSID